MQLRWRLARHRPTEPGAHRYSVVRALRYIAAGTSSFGDQDERAVHPGPDGFAAPLGVVAQAAGTAAASSCPGQFVQEHVALAPEVCGPVEVVVCIGVGDLLRELGDTCSVCGGGTTVQNRFAAVGGGGPGQRAR